jgi:hypothetical protein
MNVCLDLLVTQVKGLLYTILTYDLKTIKIACFDCIGVDPFHGGSGNNGNGVVNSNYGNHVEIDLLLDTLKLVVTNMINFIARARATSSK